MPAGNHFAFIIHRDIDIDRDRVDIVDRQRNEIKTYDQSEEAVKGFEGETFVYRWKFKINAEMEVSTRFTHFFQLKAVGGDDSQPIITAREVAQTVLDLCGNNIREQSMPPSSGLLTMLTYIAPALARYARPMLERKGQRVKARLKVEKGQA